MQIKTLLKYSYIPQITIYNIYQLLVKTAGQDHGATYARPYKYLSKLTLFNLLLKNIQRRSIHDIIGKCIPTVDTYSNS